MGLIAQFMHANMLSCCVIMFYVYVRCELKILSDASLYSIETVLKHHGLMDYFSEIITNPGHVDEEGC